MGKSLDHLQKDIDTILQVYKKPYWDPLSNLAHLCEEVGEVARVINHKYGDKPKKSTDKSDDLEDELADVLWSLICIANQEGISLESGLKRTINKLFVRDKDRFEKKVIKL